MRLRNFLLFFLLVAAAAGSAIWLVRVGAPITDMGKWLWTVGTMMSTALIALVWKVHDAKKVQGLTPAQTKRVCEVAERINRRLMGLFIFVVLVAFAGQIAAFLPADFPKVVSATAVAGAFVAAVLWALWTVRLTSDLRAFEDRVRRENDEEKRLQSLESRVADSIREFDGRSGLPDD